ncbi:uncharacterized protein DUF3558 [Saccharothrix carnea]|uniref:Uncharacterized protein DUF3558 n=1 Tax=Saccharothrix carnea TaxID=1280637 RepID=A0A2P8I1P2_SACCR|nr:DUF3558 family protein [Saccharothrix carnea]PSL52381.1 uncharacterized protein DUF3558 [Saccharothrix carnea]
MNRATTRFLIGCATGLALLATACTSSSPESAPTAVATAPSGDDLNRALADLPPCELLTSDEVGRLGLEYPGVEDRSGDADVCSWRGGASGQASAGIHPSQGLDGLGYRSDQVKPTKIGKYEAARVEAPQDAAHACHVVIETSASSSVQVIATGEATSTDTAAACALATEAAELIAPKLP